MAGATALATQVGPVLVQLIHAYVVGVSVHVAVSVTGVLGTGNAVDAVTVHNGTPADGCAGPWLDAQKTTGFGVP